MKKNSLCLCLVLVVSLMLGSFSQNFWGSNELRIITICEAKETNYFFNEMASVSSIENSEIEELKFGIIDFFENVYQINIAEKINELEVFTYSEDFFRAEKGDLKIVTGFYSPNDPKRIFILDTIFAQKSLLNDTFVHETLHYLGFSQDNLTYLTEGFVDALTSECLNYLQKNFSLSSVYEPFRNLAEQILVVDKEIVCEQLTHPDFDLAKRMNERLASLKQPFLKLEKDKIAENLENCLSHIAWSRLHAEEEPELEMWQAQEIVTAYLKTFNPTPEQISEIRNHYIIQDFEKIKIKQKKNHFILSAKTGSNWNLF